MQRIAFGVLGIGLCAGIAQAQQDVIEIYGFEFALIGDPGNRDTTDDEVPLFPGTRIGGVEYEYRLAITEVTVAQHLEFVEAYYPFNVVNTGSEVGLNDFTGRAIRAAFGQIHILPDYEPQDPTDMSWEYAARYVNWLHNGKVVESWAFESGVYDTSTFVQDDNGNSQHQIARAPGSRFFLPTLDEWTKAAHWDPSKNGGAGGYWRYPNGSDIEPRIGLPADGGERNAGERPLFPLGVVSYPHVRSPWGMYDMAGGQSELTESARRVEQAHLRRLCGSDFHDEYGDLYSQDQIGFATEVPAFSVQGLRLGTISEVHPADLNQDGVLNFFDVSQFLRWYLGGDLRADFRRDERLDLDDVRVFLGFVAAQ